MEMSWTSEGAINLNLGKAGGLLTFTPSSRLLQLKVRDTGQKLML